MIHRFLVLVVLALIVGCNGFHYSGGERTGTVFKFSSEGRGFICPTMEGELSLGMMERGADGAMFPAVFAFTVKDPDVALKVQKAQRSGSKVTLKYKQYLMRMSCWGDTPYDVVEVIE